MRALRLLYQCLLLLHPAGFRRRFGAEMLDIFDLSARESHTAYLLLDAVRSIFLQHVRPAFDPEPTAAFRLEVRTSSLTAARVSQATALGSALLFLLASLLAREIPPRSVFDSQPACHGDDEPQAQGGIEIVR